MAEGDRSFLSETDVHRALEGIDVELNALVQKIYELTHRVRSLEAYCPESAVDEARFQAGLEAHRCREFMSMVGGSRRQLLRQIDLFLDAGQKTEEE